MISPSLSGEIIFRYDLRGWENNPSGFHVIKLSDFVDSREDPQLHVKFADVGPKLATIRNKNGFLLDVTAQYSSSAARIEGMKMTCGRRVRHA